MTNPTYGVTTAAIEAYLPQWEAEATGDPHTAARITTLIEGQAAILNGRLIGAGFTPDDIDADTAGPAYQICTAVIIGCILPHILNGLEFAVDPDNAHELATWAKDWLKDFKKDPAILGFEDSSTYPRAYTTVQALDLATTDTARKERRSWDAYGGATGDPNTKTLQR